MTIPENLTALDAAAAGAAADLALLEQTAANIRSFVSAYALFGQILSAKTGTHVPGNYSAIKAALESLPDQQ